MDSGDGPSIEQIRAGILERQRRADENIARLRGELDAEVQLRNRAIVDAYEAGFTIAEIARAARLSPTSVLRIVAEAG